MNRFIEKYKLLPVQLKASLWFALCSILQKGIAFITMPLFTRLMDTEQFGYYTIYTSWYSIILVFTSLNLYYGAFNNAMIKFHDDINRFVSSMQGLTFTITGILFLVYINFADFFNPLLGINTFVGCLLFLQLLFAPAYEFWLAENRFDYHYSKIVRITLLKSLLNPLLGLIFVLISDEKEYARILSLVIIEIIFCGTIALNRFKTGKSFYDKKYWTYALSFNIPLLPHYLSGQILNQSDRIMIGHFIGNTAVAIYSVAYSIGLLSNIFTTAINGSITPWFYKKLNNKDYDNIGNVILFSVIFMAFIALGMMIFGPEIIAILAPAEYRMALSAIPPVASSVVFIFSYNLFANLEFYFEKKKFVLIGSIASAALNVLLNYIFIPKYGFVAASYSTLFCYLVYCLLHAFFALSICKDYNIPIKIFRIPSLVIVWGISIAICLFSNLLYHSTLLRYMLILLLILIAVLFRNKILFVLKTLRK